MLTFLIGCSEDSSAELPEKITCSFGVAALSEETFQSLLKRADDALYQAKTNGRNCVIVASK